MLVEDTPEPKLEPEPEIKPEGKKFSLNPKTRRIILISAIAVLALALLYVIVTRYFWKGSSSTINPLKIGKQETVASLLNGAQIDKDSQKRTPVAVVVENQPDSRPQSGLAYADIVYEALAEGGITRFMPVYQSNFPEKVGPVRSARTYFIDWVSEYNAFFAHYGGNYDALAKIKIDKIQDLDEFANAGSKAYWRENVPGVSSEHTAYCSISKLYDLGVSKKYSKDLPATFQPWLFKKDIEQEGRPASQKVTIDFSSSQFQVVWNYDNVTNTYLREMAGSQHIDKSTGKQIKAKNIIIQEVASKPIITEINEQGLEMTTVGSGKAKVILDGKVIESTWKKVSRTDRTNFYDSAGEKIELNPGQIWLEIVPPGTKITIS